MLQVSRKVMTQELSYAQNRSKTYSFHENQRCCFCKNKTLCFIRISHCAFVKPRWESKLKFQSSRCESSTRSFSFQKSCPTNVGVISKLSDVKRSIWDSIESITSGVRPFLCNDSRFISGDFSNFPIPII